MGKLMGFLEYDRCLPSDRDPLERLNDWEEIHETLPQKEQLEQGKVPDGLSPELMAQAQQGANMQAVNKLNNAMR